MRIPRLTLVWALVLAVAFGPAAVGNAESDVKMVKKAVDRSTLNQPGTKPFHLKAVLTPSREKDAGSNRSGEVEIWWASPDRYRREVRSPEFHQIAIVNGGREWQKNEGDYFPEWLRELAVELIAPVPPLDEVLEQVKTADVKKMFGSTNFSWMIMSTDGNVKTYEGASVNVSDKTGLLFYAGGLGWFGGFADYADFHGRMVARTVSAGSPEVTAKVTLLEEWRDVAPGFFDATASGGDAALLRTVVVEETAMRKNLLPMDQPVWPPMQDGPLEGTVTADLVIDRAGRVREIGTIVSTIQGASETAGKIFMAMKFKPYLQNGEPVQVVGRISLPIRAVRPAGTETFDSAHDYFEHGRHVGFPAAGKGPPYVLEAVFKAKVKEGTNEDGKYVDTWISADEWRREASIGKSRYVRSQQGDRRYQMAEGPDVTLLRLVLRAMEPIPAIDTFVESDWRIKRDTVGGVKTIRVLAGYESPDGKLDPEQSRGYWFDEDGRLVKTYFRGIETRRSDFQDLNGVAIAHDVQLLLNGALGMEIRVTQVSPTEAKPADFFELRKHEWNRAFTDEVR
jgi:hypothetical protein